MIPFQAKLETLRGIVLDEIVVVVGVTDASVFVVRSGGDLQALPWREVRINARLSVLPVGDPFNGGRGS